MDEAEVLKSNAYMLFYERTTSTGDVHHFDAASIPCQPNVSEASPLCTHANVVVLLARPSARDATRTARTVVAMMIY